MNALPGEILVVETHGYSPRFWEGRSVVFVANLLSLFFGNRGETYLLENEIPDVDSYGGRLLPILSLLFNKGDNLLVLEREPEPALTDYFRDTLGLALPEIAILPHARYETLAAAAGKNGELPDWPVVRKFREHPATLTDGFVTDTGLGDLSAALGKTTLSTPDGSRRGNNKYLLHRALVAEGLPVFETILAESPKEIPEAIARLGKAGYAHAVVKAQVGASGIGLRRLATGESHPNVPASFFHEGPCMVQGWLAPGTRGVTEVLSPSVQMFLDDEAVYLFDLTEQILSGEASVHEGNESPPPYLDRLPDLAPELFRQAGIAGRWLHEQGYRGTASTDFLVTLDGSESGPTVYVCEINARVTGATYPSVLARHFFPRGSWLMRNLKFAHATTGAEILALLRDHGHLFTGKEASGILPVNFNLTRDGLVEKGQFLSLAESPKGCAKAMRQAEEDLPLDWSYLLDR